jgi:hypothetical protein
MPFESGHEKLSGRKLGTANRVTREAAEVARRLLGDPEYQRSLRKRLIRGEAPRVELHLWELAYGKPRMELDEAPEGADSILQMLETIPPAPRAIDQHDGEQDPVSPASASPEANGEKN